MDIILIGAQGSGKGTQAEMLERTLAIPHVATGDLFRKALEEKTKLGLKAKAYIDRGELVPDEITVAMLLSRLEEADCSHGVLLDGFPRTIAQAQALDTGLQEGHKQGPRRLSPLSVPTRQINLVLYLKVPRQELLDRLSGRYICRANQHVYNILSHPSKVPGICDLDGSELYQRSDDSGEAIQRRLDIFFSETIHLLDYYASQHKLREVDGNQSIDQVQTALLHIIKEEQH